MLLAPVRRDIDEVTVDKERRAKHGQKPSGSAARPPQRTTSHSSHSAANSVGIRKPKRRLAGNWVSAGSFELGTQPTIGARPDGDADDSAMTSATPAGHRADFGRAGADRGFRSPASQGQRDRCDRRHHGQRKQGVPYS